MVCCTLTISYFSWLLRSCQPWAHCFLFFCQITQIPISWKKSELGARIQWIGWLINFRAGTISIPQPKLDKLADYLKEMLKSSKTNRKALEKLIGLLMWLTQIFPLMRIWIHYLYQDLYTVPATHFSIDAGDWPRLHTHLSDDLTFISRPHQSAIPIGSSLLAVRHQSVTKKQDLQLLHVPTEKRIWLRVKDPGSSRRTVREDSCRVLKLLQSWISTLVPTRSLCPKPFWSGHAAADACASGNTTQIGGFIQNTSGRTLWFSERFTHSDFQFLPFPIDSAMQKNISAFETLAQIGLVWLAASFFLVSEFLFA